jgi:hypothetical protein
MSISKTLYKSGMKVRIIQDCRDGCNATGKIGVYEGDFPLTVALNVGGEFLSGEWDYAAYESGALKTKAGRTVKDLFPLWTGGKQPEAFAMPMTNPRIKLDDGSVIWGAECWWEPMDGLKPHTLEEAQSNLEDHKAALRDLYRVMNEEAQNR